MGPCLPSMAERPNLESSFSLESIQNGHHFIVGFKMFLNNLILTLLTLSSFDPCSPFFYQLTIYLDWGGRNTTNEGPSLRLTR